MMKVGKKIGAMWATVVMFFAGITPAFAQSILLNDPLGGGESFASIANSVVNFLSTTIAIPLTVIMVLVGAFQISTSAGDPEKFSKGRKTILYAAIGFIIAIIATGVTSIIKSLLGTS